MLLNYLCDQLYSLNLKTESKIINFLLHSNFALSLILGLHNFQFCVTCIFSIALTQVLKIIPIANLLSSSEISEDCQKATQKAV